MSEPHKDQNPAKSPETAKLDSSSASAALAQAVASAEKSGEKSAKPESLKAESTTTEAVKTEPTKTEAAKTESTKTEPVKTESLKTEVVKTSAARTSLRPLPPEWRTHATRAAALVVAIGLGWAGGSQALSSGKQASPVMPEWAEAATAGILQNRDDLVRLTGDVRVLKNIVEAMKDSFDQAKIEAAGQQRILIERTDGLERTAQETAAKIAHVLEASGRIERASADAGAKLVGLAGRLDDIERQAKAAAVKPVATAADGPSHTGSVPEAKAAAKEIPLEGWILRDVYAGVALVESRGGRLHEVVPGTKLPSVGRVEAIERRGRTWVVVTSKGIIGVPERWQ